MRTTMITMQVNHIGSKVNPLNLKGGWGHLTVFCPSKYFA